jgi:hypothetical protein
LSSSATFINLRVYSAEQFKESVSEQISNNNIYLTYGKIDAWADEESPNEANTATITQYDVWYNLIGGKRLFGNDVSHVVKRYDWSSGNTYTAYDHRSNSLYSGNTQFYVLTSDYSVYKCLSNNNSAVSTIEPTSINPSSPTETSDGYIWKYMYSLSDSELLRFTTANYIPVKTLPSNDGSLQWNVQQNATEGAIYNIIISNTGSGYTNTNNIFVNILGDGASATATANINVSSQTVSSITMTDYGQSYTYATVSITGGGGSGAEGVAIISPIGGHGSDPVYELGGAALMLNSQFRGTEGNKLPATNDIRQIALIKDPLRPDSNVMSNLKFLHAYTLTAREGTGDYLADEIVYQGSSISSASFRGRILSWDSSNSLAYIINSFGTPTSQSLVGANSSTSRFVSQIQDRELKGFSGDILYVNNIKPIIRSSDQTEEFKIVVKF